ncbi:MAG: hypothetical protein M1828_006846 [Chrysothrix sp. TS-e1954]|nr:MAG: hypothetical protein M1828_006846 [Chrysothrix sp. TS-e1954]
MPEANGVTTEGCTSQPPPTLVTIRKDLPSKAPSKTNSISEMCHTHQTHHACTHTSKHTVLCLNSLKHVIRRATVFPYQQGLPAVKPATHNTIVSGSTSDAHCASCLSTTQQPAFTHDDTFFLNSGAANFPGSSDSLTRNLTVSIEGDKVMASKMHSPENSNTAGPPGFIASAPVPAELLPFIYSKPSTQKTLSRLNGAKESSDTTESSSAKENSGTKESISDNEAKHTDESYSKHACQSANSSLEPFAKAKNDLANIKLSKYINPNLAALSENMKQWLPLSKL